MDFELNSGGAMKVPKMNVVVILNSRKKSFEVAAFLR